MNPFLTTSFTNYCNLGCNYCVAHCYDWKKTKKSIPRFIDFIHPVALSKWTKKYWPENTVLNITGGEPMVHPFADQAIRYLSENHKLIVCSNGIDIPISFKKNPPNVFWNLTYHASIVKDSFEEWLDKINFVLRQPYRISYLSKEKVDFDSDLNVDFRLVNKNDKIINIDYSYNKELTPNRFALITPDGLVYSCNHAGEMFLAAKQPTKETLDCNEYYKNPRKITPIGDIYSGEYNIEAAKRSDKHTRECLREKKCNAYISQLRIEHYAKEQGFLPEGN